MLCWCAIVVLWLCGGVVLKLCGAVVFGVMCLANCGRRYSLYSVFGVSASRRSNFFCICDSSADDHGILRRFFFVGTTQGG